MWKERRKRNFFSWILIMILMIDRKEENKRRIYFVRLVTSILFEYEKTKTRFYTPLIYDHHSSINFIQLTNKYAR